MPPLGVKFCVEVVLKENTDTMRAVTARTNGVDAMIITDGQLPYFRIGIICEPPLFPRPIAGLLAPGNNAQPLPSPRASGSMITFQWQSV